MPQEGWVELENRGTEQLDVAELEFTPEGWPNQAFPLRYVAVRFTPLQAEMIEPRAP